MLDLFTVSPYSRKRLEPTQFEKQLSDMLFGFPESNVNFPKYNIYVDMDGSPYINFMELALAGYRRENLDIKVEEGYLKVSGRAGEDIKTREYSHRGMAQRDFNVRFKLEGDVEVRSAHFSDGLLTIELEKLVPDEKKPKTIEIH